MSGLRVLVVEDEFIVAYELEGLLESMGYHVCRVVGSGERALEAVWADRPDCVLMDVNLRGCADGIEVATAIRRELETPIVLLTGLPARDMDQPARELAITAVLTKPIDHSELRAVLGAITEEVRATGPADTLKQEAVHDD